METIRVRLAGRSYAIHLGADVLDHLGRLAGTLDLARRAALITNPTVARLYGARAMAALEGAGFAVALLTVPEGEAEKSLPRAGLLFEALASHRLERRSPIVALGGGVIGDLAGFVAATYLRGLPLIQVPTSLLAQVDSSVGGKVAVNLAAGKNLVGAFHQPALVVTDVATLGTLPEREYAAGLAEVVKYGVIADADLFAYLEANVPRVLERDPGALVHLVGRSCQIKAAVVERDERDEGERAVLNFGHTLGHALEAAAGYGPLLHGEAVAVGMVAAARLSVARGLCARQDLDRLAALLRALGLPTEADLDVGAVLRHVQVDKKVRDGVARFVLTTGIGSVTVAPVSDLSEIADALRSHASPPV